MAHQMTCALQQQIVTANGERAPQNGAVSPPSGATRSCCWQTLGLKRPPVGLQILPAPWPVSGRFTSPQRDIYDVVLAAHDAAIAEASTGG